MNEYLVFADGTKVENSYIVKLDDERIIIYAPDVYSFRDAYSMFCNPEKNTIIHSYQYGDEADWEGFTEPISVNTDSVHGASVCLHK